MKNNLYIGEFPPPIGGVTVKNTLIKNRIYMDAEMDFFDMYSCKKNPFRLLFLFIKIIFVKGNIVLGIGSNKRLERLLQIIKMFRGRSMLNRCSVIMMGSTLQDYTKISPSMTTLLKCVKFIFSESCLINEDFSSQGIMQTQYFPNCRELSINDYSEKQLDSTKPMKLVFFSKICREKGAHILFDVLTILNKYHIPVTLDYYGVVAQDYKAEFEESLVSVGNATYKGVFDSSKDDVYRKLNEYDILLFPTTWLGEGVPGILVESKVAGIPSIVTDHNYNSEIVIDGKEGIVVSKENIIYGYINAIQRLYQNKELYKELSRGALQSRYRYDIERYREILMKAIQE